MRVFFDASVIIAALLSLSGGSSLLLRYIKKGVIIGITSQTALDEILEEDKGEKLKKSKVQREQFIAESGLMVRERISREEIRPYESIVEIEDAHVIAGAYFSKCTHLVTLDKKHLLQPAVQKAVSPLKIVSPKELLEELVSY